MSAAAMCTPSPPSAACRLVLSTPPALRSIASTQPALDAHPMLQHVDGSTLMLTPQRATVAVSLLTTPPHAPQADRGSLSHVLRMNSVQELKRLHRSDENIVHVPVCDRGCDPPVLSAVVHGCSADVVGFLLRHGSAVHGLDLNGLSAIQNLALGSAGRTEMKELPMFLRNPVPQFPVGPSPPWADAGEAGSGLAFQLPMLPPLPPWTDTVGGELLDAKEEQRCCDVGIWLLSFGADPLQKDANGLTAVDHARKTKQLRLASLLAQWPSRMPVRVLRRFLVQGPAAEGDLATGLRGMPPGVADHILDFMVASETSAIWGRAVRPDGHL